jgi:Uma2 family endonuclease
MSIAEPTTRRWTVAEYHRAAEAGIFGPEERLELIDGEIYRMSPQKGPHLVATGLTRSILEKVFQEEWVVLVQAPLALGEQAEPEPDVAVVRGQWRDFVEGPPATAELVVEVSDTTLAFDRGPKATGYARAGISDYWVLSIPERVLEVRRNPDPSTGQYQSIVRYNPDETVSPLAAPTVLITVRDLLP